MQSFIRWAGSKKQLLRHLRPYWPGPPARYVEPFAGSACLFFDLQPSEAILGDLNWELISTMRQVQRNVNQVLRHLHKFQRGKASYYRIRRIDPRELTEAEVAARFIYLNRYCFNGLFRTNTSGHFNVPYRPPKRNQHVDDSLIIAASGLLRRASLIHGDFETTALQARTGDFVYLDPPYFVSRRRVFSQYGPKTFSSSDLSRMNSVLFDLHKIGAKFVVTYADSQEARKLLKPWQPRRVKVRRNIAGFTGYRRTSYELLATNLNLQAMSHANRS